MFCEALICGIISSAIVTIAFRIYDKRRKNDRHSPKHGH